MNSLRGGMLGAGYFSRFPYEAWRRLSHAGIVAAVNRDVAKVRATAARHGIPHAAGWSGLAAVLDAERPDFVGIITPPETHLEAVRRDGSSSI